MPQDEQPLRAAKRGRTHIARDENGSLRDEEVGQRCTWNDNLPGRG